jgi:hypothetical protein
MDSTTRGIIPWHRSHLVREGRNLLSHPWICKLCDLLSTRQLFQLIVYWRLTEKHDGLYLAKVLAACVELWTWKFCRSAFLNLSFPPWFIVQIHALCMDNAGNCNTTAYNIGTLLPYFHGTVSRTQCFPHILNLVAKVSRESCLQHILNPDACVLGFSCILFWTV